MLVPNGVTMHLCQHKNLEKILVMLLPSPKEGQDLEMNRDTEGCAKNISGMHLFIRELELC